MTNKVLFDALASATRRKILEQLRAGPRSVNELTAGLNVSQPAVSQHLRMLLEAQLVQVHPQGNRRFYALDPRGLGALKAYLTKMWDEAIESYVQAAEVKSEEVKYGNSRQ